VLLLPYFYFYYYWLRGQFFYSSPDDAMWPKNDFLRIVAAGNYGTKNQYTC